MASRTWKFTIADKQHVVNLDHNFWSSRRVITLDGKTVLDRTPIDNLRHEYEFGCRGRKLKVVVGRSYWTLSVSYELQIDGETIPPDSTEPSGQLLRPAGHAATNKDDLLRAGSPDREQEEQS